MSVRSLQRRTVVILMALAVCLAGSVRAVALLESAAFVSRAADLDGWPGASLAGWGRIPVTREAFDIPTTAGPIRTRLSRPERPLRRSLLLIGGVHAEGIDEPRLVKLAEDLAESGLGVLTPELVDLTRYRISPGLPGEIAEAAIWSASQPDLAPDGRIGLVGISFAGGLSLVAAGLPATADRVSFVLSFGGHGDLVRVLRFLCTGLQPDGTRRAPHDYGVVVVLLNLADRLVPADQVDGLRDGIVTFLRGSHLAMVDSRAAARVFEEAIAHERTLDEPARSLLHAVNTRDVATLGPLLLPHLPALAGAATLSPARSTPPRAPVFLLHGADDNVIPALESRLLADAWQDAARVHLLITPLITHAEVDRRAGVWDVVRLVEFWRRILAE